MAKYSIHRCLGELKTINSRINNAINNANFVGRKKNSDDRVQETYTTEKVFCDKANSDMQKITDLMERAKEIKEAVVQSNAVTKVTIGGKEMTVASAIERKNSIRFEKALLEQMKYQYDTKLMEINRANDRMESNLDSQLTNLTGSDSNNKNTDNMKGFSEMFRKQNGWTLIDPLNIKDQIEKLEKDISDFETEVDYILSTSNSITEVDITD